MSKSHVEESRKDTLLTERLRERIKREGPITFRDWMSAALYDEREGYYLRSDLTRWGRAGDYRTIPERTPLFAATFARHFAKLYEELGAPTPFTILEAGAGGGHFAKILLSTLSRDHTNLFSSIRYVIDEISGDSRVRVAKLLEDFGGKVEFGRIDEIKEPTLAGIIFSNELIDAFPVHRVILRHGEILELFVGLDAQGEFVFLEQAPSTPLLVQHLAAVRNELHEGQIVEVNLEAGRWIARAAASLKNGFVITVDYGAEAQELYSASHRYGGTLRSFGGHKLEENVLENPGSKDLTTTVDWTQLIIAGESAGLTTVSLTRLDKFLLAAGIVEQLEREMALAESESQKTQLALGAREVILPGGMCESFQVLIQKKGSGR